MHCDKCNVDFGEGLRYCKWCGESLVDVPRVTSELHTCPSCAAAVQPTWAYCKSCGERLHAAAREPVSAVCPRCGAVTSPGALNCLRCGEDLTDGAAASVAQESADTSIIAMCSSCGERLDTGSLYCKACGSAVYNQQVPFGGSAMLCGACNSYSPFGSRACRVCGAPFAQSQQTVVDRPILHPVVQHKPPTLPDLDEKLPQRQPPAIQEQPEVTSGANTLVFTGPQQEEQRTARNRATVETNMLPGTPGERSEHPTSIMQMGRITGPVEGEVNQPPPAAAEPTSGGLGGATGADQFPLAAEPAAEVPVVSAQEPPAEPTTLGFGTESEARTAGSESKTEVFVSRPQEAQSAPRPKNPEDEVRTREFAPPERPRDLEQTRQIPAIGTAAQDLQPTRQISSWSPGPGVPSAEPISTREYGQSEPFPSAPAHGSSQPLPKKRTGVTIASLVVAAMVIGAAIFVAWWFLFARAKPAPKPVVVADQPAPAPPVSTLPEKPPAPVVPEGMVMVSAGTYTVGRDDGDPIEQPQHRIDLPAFFIDRTEVTNASYKKFIDATGHKPPSNWSGATYPEGRGEAPVTSVTWQDATDYARWANKRLPTESEWEAAARGPEGRIYPWGSDWRGGVANIGLKPDKPRAEQYPAGLRDVAGYPQGASPFGAVDMIGNAWEWVADEIKLYPGNTVSSLEIEPGYRVIRGGAYDGNKVHDATYRGYLDGSVAYPKVGFRCAKDAK
ncbi:MAG TPA: SUMF1/EgtB/PvdO family nonheme iron enzyme [Blastocatellia bacterium]|nr:SUMF1/EgtB/PvdO family nonheme iron enzyme [Blastocatellia bacterium]